MSINFECGTNTRAHSWAASKAKVLQEIYCLDGFGNQLGPGVYNWWFSAFVEGPFSNAYMA